MAIFFRQQSQMEDCTLRLQFSHFPVVCVQAVLEVSSSVFGITHTICIDGKHGLSLWQARGVVDFTDPCLASAFPQVQTANSTS